MTWPPGKSEIGWTPIACASRSYSPLTSTIHACRPDEHVDDVRKGRLTIRSSRENSEGFLADALLLGGQRPFERSGADRIEEVELSLRAAARRERVELYVAARRDRDRLHADGRGEPVVLALDVDDPRLAPEH